MLRVPRTAAAVLGATAAVAPLALLGCGGDDQTYENRDRPAAPIQVTAYVAKDKVSVSPGTFGAGPITLIVTNHTDRSQQVTLETSDSPGSSRAGVRQETGPINPRDTATIQADVRQGAYTVHVSGGDIRAAKIAVGAARPSAQQDLLLP
jgi:hypothetical protein